MERHEKLALLNAETAAQRLENLAKLLSEEESKPTVLPQYANNHIHTFYSFSPYSPTAAVYFAREAGLPTAGIMDHDSIAGADEFRAAGKIAGIGTTCGFECRVNMEGTPFSDKKINNPDQKGIAYMALHSVPAASFEKVQKKFDQLRCYRNERNAAMVEKVNEILSPYGVTIDFQQDVVPLSHFHEGGSVTERHLLCAVADKIIDTFGDETLDFLENKLGLSLSPKQREWIAAADPIHFRYDVLGVLKSSLNERTYLPAGKECMTLAEAVDFANEIGAILCYAYLGDIEQSPTGDKKAAKFEDEYLDELFAYLKEAGVHGITYMPSRNTEKQMARLMQLCRTLGFTEISGEDINSSRQGFICKELEKPEFKHLVAKAWELVEREK